MYAGNIDLILRTMVSEKRSYLFVIHGDAVYSIYKRFSENKIEFVKFLDQPAEFPEHFPGMFQFTPRDLCVFLQIG